jgi:DNA-binding Xre family transcriptional regulator
MKLGLREAAKSSELSLSMWQYIETGKTENPRLNTLHKVAKTLKCNVGDLVD